jgi:hypothetical protein
MGEIWGQVRNMTSVGTAVQNPYVQIRVIVPYVVTEVTSTNDSLRVSMGFISVKSGDEEKLLKLFSRNQRAQDKSFNRIISIPKGTIIIVPRKPSRAISISSIEASTHRTSSFFKRFIRCFCPCKRIA